MRNNADVSARGRANAAQALLKTLPSGIEKLSFDHDEGENVSEFEQVRALFVVFANYEIIEDVLGVMPKATCVNLLVPQLVLTAQGYES